MIEETLSDFYVHREDSDSVLEQIQDAVSEFLEIDNFQFDFDDYE